MSVDPFTPWQEDPRTLRSRTVGRADALEWLDHACKEFLSGGRPSWCLVAGARGVGKSHLLQLAWGTLPENDRGAVTWIGEDTPSHPTADGLWASIWNQEDPWGWTPKPEHHERRILFVEGIDRLSRGLKGKQEPWRLRHLLHESGCLLVATALTPAVAGGEDSAFFGQFDTWTLQNLDLDESDELFRAVSGELVAAPPEVLTRRTALVRLAGGSPRALVTLAEAVRDTEEGEIGTAEGLLRAVQHLVPHYQQRFFDLPALGQQILQVLAQAPRELHASEVQQLTRSSSAAVSGAARVLEAAGTLTRSSDPEDGRVSRYALSEPMFRYWLEYRTTQSWESTRISWCARLLGEVLTRDQIALMDPSSTTKATSLDAGSVINAAHLRRDGAVLRRLAPAVSHLPVCSAPERPAPDPEPIVLAMNSQALDSSLSWAASLAAVPESNFVEAVERLSQPSPVHVDHKPSNIRISAYLALGLRTPGRLADLRSVLPPDDLSMQTAMRTLRQLDERANGPLQHELELVWRAVAPEESS